MNSKLGFFKVRFRSSILNYSRFTELKKGNFQASENSNLWDKKFCQNSLGRSLTCIRFPFTRCICIHHRSCKTGVGISLTRYHSRRFHGVRLVYPPIFQLTEISKKSPSTCFTAKIQN